MAPDRRAIAAILATAIAVPAEGLRQWAYRDPGPAIWTVCYGDTGPDVVPGRKYTVEECKDRLNKDMLDAVTSVDRCVPGLPPQVLAAFGDAVYNIGPVIACDTTKSTAARLLRAGRIPEACAELPKWDKTRVAGVLVALPGLTKRRKDEMQLCLSTPTF